MQLLDCCGYKAFSLIGSLCHVAHHFLHIVIQRIFQKVMDFVNFRECIFYQMSVFGAKGRLRR